MEAVHDGHPAAPRDSGGGRAATSGHERAGGARLGQWAPSTFAANAKKKKGPEVGWFPFPVVDGGAGSADEQFGGGDGFAFGKDAPPETVDFAKVLVSPEIAHKAGASGSTPALYKGQGSAV